MYKRLLKKQTQMAETLFSHHDGALSLLLKARRRSDDTLQATLNQR